MNDVIDFKTKRENRLRELGAKYKLAEINLRIQREREKELLKNKAELSDQIKSMCRYNDPGSDRCDHPGRKDRRKIFGKDDRMRLCNISFCPYVEEGK